MFLIGSTNGVHGDFPLCFAEGVVASTDWSKMIRRIANSIRVAIPLGQSGGAHVLAPGSIRSGGPPTNLAYGSEVAVVVDEGALRELARHGTDLRFRTCFPRCTDSDTKTQPFTMPMLTPTEEDQTMSGWRRRVSVSVLSMVWIGVRRLVGQGQHRTSLHTPCTVLMLKLSFFFAFSLLFVSLDPRLPACGLYGRASSCQI